MTRYLHRTVALTLAVLALITSTATAAPGARPNVLFIAVDDLRPSLGCYGDTAARTPVIDRLASSGVLFSRAYCQQAVCSPSRSSLLTGRRPDSTRVYDLKTHFRRALPDAVTLPQYFKEQGYATQAIGKIYHNGLDDAPSWSHGSEPVGNVNPDKNRSAKTPQPRVGAAKAPGPKAKTRGPSWEAQNVEDDALPDGQIARKAIDALRRLKDEPFFLAVGFYKPHLPFVAPKRFFDLYPPGSLPAPPPDQAPSGAPAIALTNFGELRTYADIPSTGPLPEGKPAELIRGYYASTSYADAQIGRVLDELDRLGLRENTIIVLWGDHGWHLGDQGLWCKHTNFEAATRAPLVISVPGKTSAGAKSPALVELVDVYPTLCELAGLKIPDSLEGTSLAPLIRQPGRPWKSAAFSQYPRERTLMGYSVRTDRHRYTEWIDRRTSTTVAAELYDHETDPGETKNLATNTDDTSLTPTLSRTLHAGWREAKPPEP